MEHVIGDYFDYNEDDEDYVWQDTAQREQLNVEIERLQRITDVNIPRSQRISVSLLASRLCDRQTDRQCIVLYVNYVCCEI